MKYQLLAQNTGGRDYQHFHASEDKQAVRDAVFTSINTLTGVHINYIIAEKRKAHPTYQNANFYGLLGSALVKYLLKIHRHSPYEKVVIIFNQALPNKDKSETFDIFSSGTTYYY